MMRTSDSGRKAPPPSIKLLVVDVDGTLVGSSGVPTTGVREAISRAQAAGLMVALCSGRPLASCWPIARDLGLRGAHIVFNGALVKDPSVVIPILSRPLAPNTTRAVVDYCRLAGLCLELYTEETHFVEHDWEQSRLHAISIRVTYERLTYERADHDRVPAQLSGFDQLVAENEILKCQIITANDRERELAARLGRQLAGQVGYSVAIPMAPCVGCECVNIVDPRVSKGQAVRALTAHLGLTSNEVAGAGDAPNDLPVFAEVGYRIAMGNAHPDLLALADYVAPDVEDDGLAMAIDDLIH